MLIDPENLQMRYNFACTLCRHLQDAEGAINLLKSVLSRDPGGSTLETARTDPDLDSIRQDPRFQEMMAETEARLAKTTAA